MKTSGFMADIRPCTVCGSGECLHLGAGVQRNQQLRNESKLRKALGTLDFRRKLGEYMSDYLLFGDAFVDPHHPRKTADELTDQEENP